MKKLDVEEISINRSSWPRRQTYIYTLILKDHDDATSDFCRYYSPKSVLVSAASLSLS